MNQINEHKKTISGFGDEWKRFDQSALPIEEQNRLFDKYFNIFPWHILTKEAEGFDLGCGSGRWAKVVSKRVGKLHCLDPSEAIEIAKNNLKNEKNCFCYKKGVSDLPFENESMDFGYSLGVLHHIPDTASAISSCVDKLKAGAPFLVYIYYNFDNKSFWYRILWKITDYFRAIISRLPYLLRYYISQLIAAMVYFPLSKIAKLLSVIKINVDSFPLSFYKDSSFYTMRTDALDRFGTIFEKRFSKEDINKMLLDAGLENIVFSESSPFWCAVGTKVNNKVKIS